jgi:hypothetical protein
MVDDNQLISSINTWQFIIKTKEYIFVLPKYLKLLGIQKQNYETMEYEDIQTFVFHPG